MAGSSALTLSLTGGSVAVPDEAVVQLEPPTSGVPSIVQPEPGKAAYCFTGLLQLAPLRFVLMPCCTWSFHWQDSGVRLPHDVRFECS